MKENLEVLKDCLAWRVTLYANRQHIFFNLRHWSLTHDFFKLLAEHNLAFFFQLRELFQVLADAHDLSGLLTSESGFNGDKSIGSSLEKRVTLDNTTLQEGSLLGS